MNLKSKTAMLIIISFLLGGVAGGFVGSSLFPKHRSRSSYVNVMKEFAERVRLEKTQQQAIDSLMEAYKPKFDQIRKVYSEQFRAQRDSLRSEIRTFLSPEQNERFDEYVKEMDAREQKKRKED